MSDAAIQLGESTVKLLAECDRLRAENQGYRERVPMWQGELDQLRAENDAIGEGANRLVADNEKLNSQLTAWFDTAERYSRDSDYWRRECDRLRAENEKLQQEKAALAVEKWVCAPSDYDAVVASKEIARLRAENEELEAARKLHAGGHVACEKECGRLQTENDGYKQAMRANNMTADAHYLERHIREACLKLGGSACRDGMPMGEGLIREIENLRATALTASEANFLLRCRLAARAAMGEGLIVR